MPQDGVILLSVHKRLMSLEHIRYDSECWSDTVKHLDSFYFDYFIPAIVNTKNTSHDILYVPRGEYMTFTTDYPKWKNFTYLCMLTKT